MLVSVEESRFAVLSLILRTAIFLDVGGFTIFYAFAVIYTKSIQKHDVQSSK